MKNIEIGKNIIRININEQYAIRKHKGLKFWWLEEYSDRNHFYTEIRADESLTNLYKWFKENYNRANERCF